MKIILASASPRRKELLSGMGLEYEIIKSDCEENTEKTNPCDMVRQIAEDKAMDVRNKCLEKGYDDFILIAADTLVFLDRDPLGKPKDERDAERMLKSLSGRDHEVITGVCVLRECEGKCSKTSFAEETKVHVADLSDAEIEAYIATGEPMDKAGAYAIQGKFSRFIRGIEGDYFNVVGLPVAHLYRVLKDNGYL